MIVFITKYCLSHGILELEAAEIDGDYFVPDAPKGFSEVYYPSKKEVWLTKEEAAVRAEQIRLRRIKFLEKKVRLLKNKSFISP